MAQGDAPFFVLARPHSLGGPQATVCQFILGIFVGWRKRLHQVHIAVGAACEAGAVLGSALGAKHGMDRVYYTA
jgi:hypothetical protein